MFGHGVEVAGNGQDMKTLDESVVQNKHNGSEPPSNVRIEEEHFANISDIADLGMSETKLPGNVRILLKHE